MNLKERNAKIAGQFDPLTDWEQRYRLIIELGRSLPPLPEQFRKPDFLVQGCQSQVWLHASLNSKGQLEFVADSDAVIVKGLIALLLQLYSKATADEILGAAPDFVKTIGLEQNLTPSRANGLVAIVKQIKYYAAAFKALQEPQRA